MEVFTSGRLRRAAAARSILFALFFSLSLCGCGTGDGNVSGGNVSDVGKEISVINSKTADNTGDRKDIEAKDAETEGNETDEDVPPDLSERRPGRHPAEYYVKWAVPKGYAVSNQTLDEINYMLEQAGAGYGLKILEIDDQADPERMEISDSVYQANLDKSGADIAFIGWMSNNSDITAATVLEEGKYACLDELLQGSGLYEAIPEVLWEAVKYQGAIYYVPNEALRNEGLCVVFNTDKIPLEKAKAFDGDIFTLMEYLPEGERLYYDWGRLSFAETFGYVYDYGKDILLSDDGSVKDPFEEERCLRWFRTINQWYADGRIMGISMRRETCAIQLIHDFDKVGENTYKYVWKGSVFPRLNLSTGIRADSPRKEEALHFLGLLRTDPAYANLLVYGKEALDAEGVPTTSGWGRSLVFGLDTGLLGETGLRHFASTEEKKQYYEENIIASPSLYMNYPEECSELHAIVDKYFSQTNILQAGNFEEKLLKFQEELRPVMKKVLEKSKELNP